MSDSWTWGIFIGVAALGALLPWIILAILALRLKEHRMDLAEWEAVAMQAKRDLADIQRSARAQTEAAKQAQAATRAQMSVAERWDAASRKLRGLP